MDNFKNFELDNTQQRNTIGKGRPELPTLPELPEQASDVILPELPALPEIPQQGQDGMANKPE